MTGRRALVITEPGSIALQDVAELVPGPGEVVARPVHTGICGTDLELLAGVVDPAYVRYPLVPGHEWSGVIEAVGPGVTGLDPGQPVIAEGIIPDRVCAQCVQGHTNLCVVYDELGFTRAGAAADQVLLPAQVVHVLGGSADLLEAALAEPAAVAWRAIGRGRPRPGERVAVVGDGTLALITAHLLRLYSPAELIVCGQRPAQAAGRRARRDRLRRSDAPGHRVSTWSSRPRARPARSRRASAWPAAAAGWSWSGWPATTSRPAFPIDNAVNNDLLISASFAYTSAAFAEVTALLSAGQIRPGPLITHRFPLEAYQEAYQVLRSGSGPRGKVMLDVSAP